MTPVVKKCQLKKCFASEYLKENLAKAKIVHCRFGLCTNVFKIYLKFKYFERYKKIGFDDNNEK